MNEAELLHFEDFRSGQIFRLGRHTLTAEEIIEFASEFDPQPQHTDPDAAKHSMLGGLAASGWHLGALAYNSVAILKSGSATAYTIIVGHGIYTTGVYDASFVSNRDT